MAKTKEVGPKIDGNEFGRNLKRCREQAGYTQESFAECINKSAAFISSLECGNRTPSYSTLKTIANFLDIPVDSLINTENFAYSDERLSYLSDKLHLLPEQVQAKLLNTFEFMIDQESKG